MLKYKVEVNGVDYEMSNYVDIGIFTELVFHEISIERALELIKSDTFSSAEDLADAFYFFFNNSDGNWLPEQEDLVIYVLKEMCDSIAMWGYQDAGLSEEHIFGYILQYMLMTRDDVIQDYNYDEETLGFYDEMFDIKSGLLDIQRVISSLNNMFLLVAERNE